MKKRDMTADALRALVQGREAQYREFAEKIAKLCLYANQPDLAGSVRGLAMVYGFIAPGTAPPTPKPVARVDPLIPRSSDAATYADKIQNMAGRLVAYLAEHPGHEYTPAMLRTAVNVPNASATFSRVLVNVAKHPQIETQGATNSRTYQWRQMAALEERTA